jgi:hypothetical protein
VGVEEETHGHIEEDSSRGIDDEGDREVGREARRGGFEEDPGVDQVWRSSRHEQLALISSQRLVNASSEMNSVRRKATEISTRDCAFRSGL